MNPFVWRESLYELKLFLIVAKKALIACGGVAGKKIAGYKASATTHLNGQKEPRTLS